jgi:tetratricopeptide (TPR) repeat protein
MRGWSLVLAAVVCLAPSPAWAVKEWYDHYRDAVQKQIPAERWDLAIASLHEALRLKPTPGLGERTYGMDFLDYLPYYQLGLCYLRSGDLDNAIRMFDISEERGAVRRSQLHASLATLRSEAEDAERQRAARLARQDLERLLGEADALLDRSEHQQALARLAQAQMLADSLDPEALRRVQDLQGRIRQDLRRRNEAEERRRRIAEDLAQGQSLLQRDPTEAIVHFDQVLTLDPENRQARSGKREAEQLIRQRTTAEALRRALSEGIARFEAGQYQQAQRPLTDAAAGGVAEARDYLDRTQRILEGMRQQRKLRGEIEGLEREAEALIAAGRFDQAHVQIETLLDLDPDNVRARQRLSVVEARLGESLVAKYFPNRPPILTILDPPLADMILERDTVAVVGVATDDRAVARVELRLGNRLLRTFEPAPRLESGRNLRFDHELPVDAGLNLLSVTAIDNTGLSDSATFRLERRLRFYETAAFLPSALGAALGIVALGFGAQHTRRRLAVRRRFNPYIAGAPVMDDGMFFGRQKLLQRILNVLHHNSLVITGERRIGKTTFLYHLKRALERDSGTEYHFFPVFTDLQGVTEEGFFHAVMGDVVEALELSDETRASLRWNADEEGYDGRDFSHDVQRVIDELKTRTRDHVKLALLIDEVDVLNEYSERINQRLRSIFMKTFSEHLVAIMSGVGIRRTWNSEGSPWYNFFDEIELEALSRDEAEALIRNPVEGVFRYDAAAVQLILEHSELKPYLIQKFCIHAINRIIEARRTRVTAEDVEAVREAVHFEGRSAGTSAAMRASA